MTDARTLLLAIPHWPTIAAGVTSNSPVAVMHMSQVVDATPAAVDQGVVPGIRRREAQRLCPDLEMIDNDEARNIRRFHLIVTALESITPRVEISTGGWCSKPPKGPSSAISAGEPGIPSPSLSKHCLESLPETCRGAQGWWFDKFTTNGNCNAGYRPDTERRYPGWFLRVPGGLRRNARGSGRPTAACSTNRGILSC